MRDDAMIFGQDEREFLDWLVLVGGCHSLLEIGCRYGETSRRMAWAMPPGSRLVCVDLGCNPPIPPEEDFLGEARRRLATVPAGQCQTTLLVGNSHDEAMRQQIAQYGPFDAVFIDGDHSYAGVVRDWEWYGPLAPMVAFHDVLREKDQGPWRLWQALRLQYPHVEFGYSGGGRNLGIGVLWR